MRAFILFLVGFHAVTAQAGSQIGRCEEAKGLRVDIVVNDGDYSDRSMRNLSRVTTTALSEIAREVAASEVSQILSVYGEEGEASFCLSSCLHGLGSGTERDLSKGLRRLGAFLPTLSRPGRGFVTVTVSQIEQFSECMR